MNSNLVGILRERNATRRRRQLCSLFSELSSADSTLEAFSAALERERHLQDKQLRVLRELKTLIGRHDLTKAIGMDRVGLGKLLVSAGLAVLLVRVMLFEMPEKSGSHEKSKTGMCQDWPLCYNIAAGLLGQLSTMVAKDEVLMSELLKQQPVELLIKQLNPNDVTFVLKSFASCTALLNFCSSSAQACEQTCASGLPLLGSFILRDTPQRWVAQHCKQNMHPCEIAYLVNGATRSGISLEEKQAAAYEKMLDVSHSAQLDAINVLVQLAQHGEEKRCAIWKCKATNKAIRKWLHYPVITRYDLKKVTAMASVLSLMCRLESRAKEIVLFRDFIYSIELGVCSPHKACVLAYLDVLIIVAQHGSDLCHEITETGGIVNTVMACVWSYSHEIQQSALQLLIALASNTDSAKVVLNVGGSPHFVHVIRNFYRSVSGVTELIVQFKKAMARYCASSWKAEEKKASQRQIRMSSEVATRIKVDGNESFQTRDYLAAHENYRCASVICPPFETLCSVPTPITSDLCLPPWEFLSFKEWCLPGILYSNMAQCKLKVHEPYEAIKFCQQGLGRCLHDSDEALKLRVKIAYRRARAYLHTEEYVFALNDAAYCHMYNIDNDDSITSLFREAMIRYRDDLGRESVRVCGTCGKGAGEVLKRCANCTEVYCSRECQRQDWIGGHKLACKALGHIYDICECGKCL